MSLYNKYIYVIIYTIIYFIIYNIIYYIYYVICVYIYIYICRREGFPRPHVEESVGQKSQVVVVPRPGRRTASYQIHKLHNIHTNTLTI